MSEDQEDAAKNRYLQSHFVPKVEYDANQRNVELRLNDLSHRFDGQHTRLESIDRTVNNVIAEQAAIRSEQDVAKSERFELFRLVQDGQSFMRAAGRRLLRRLTFMCAIIGILLAALLLKDLIIPLFQ